MKTSLLFIVGIFRIISSQGRLTQKYSTQATKLKTDSTPPVRLVREVFDEDSLTGFSREEDGQSDEFVQSYNKRTKYFYKHKSPPAVARLPRGSGGNASTTNSEIKSESVSDQKTVLIKKPIPKYIEGDYEEDFQVRISKSAKIVGDSGEHEDEDFNLDDYDFDVNHDEFAGRGKPLEPRTKFKEIKEPSTELYTVPSEIEVPKAKPEIKVQSKVNAPPARTSLPSKKELDIKSRNGNKVAEKIKDEDYYEEMSMKDSSKQKPRAADDDFDENEESKEFDPKRAFIRMARSPWNLLSYADKMGEKSSTIMSKVLGILPMFPQVPGNKRKTRSLSKENEARYKSKTFLVMF